MEYLTLEESLQKVGHIIGANTFEQHALWKRYNDKVQWTQILGGHGKTIGHIDGRPVFMSFRYAEINGILTLFWTLTSEVCDYKMAEDFLLENTNIKSKVDLHDASNNGILTLKGD